MNKSITLTSILIFLFTVAYTQNLLNDAVLKYSLHYESSSTHDMLLSSWVVYLKGDQSRTDLISSSGTETIIYDAKNGKGVLLRSYSNQNLMVNLDQNEWEQLNKEFVKLKYNSTDEKILVNGYLCRKAESEGARRVTVYYTEDYMLYNVNYKLSFPNLKGLPVRIIISGNDDEHKKSAVYDLEKLDTDILPVNTFDHPKSGYRILNFSELKRGK